MQTFLPYPDFDESARCLDYRRLGKQRIETRSILSAHFWSDYGWQTHPATQMWRGYSISLAHYGITMCAEWQRRGYKDNTEFFFREILERNPTATRIDPPWLGMPKFHRSHQSNLLRKYPEHYGKFNWNVSHHLEYYWPTTEARKLENVVKSRQRRR